MNYRYIISAIAIFLAAASCDEDNFRTEGLPSDKKEDVTIGKGDFAKGADISWVTQMEEDGEKFYGDDGNDIECTALMKEIGMNAIRLRVWVDPEDGWCGKEDVLVKARRAQALGMRLMIDFHYSDSWADPSKQAKPAAWADFGVEELAEAVAGHTEEVLTLLKDNGVDVEWVQVGNEVNNGMLHPEGNIGKEETILNFVSFFNAGYNAVKKVFPQAKVILHRSDGHKTSEFDWFLSKMKGMNLKYDIIGMSLYPSWWENGGWSDWHSTGKTCISNISSFAGKYGKPVMICEVGMPVSEPEMAKEALEYLLEEARKIEDCHGIFYWEPQTDGKWKPSSYSALGWNAYSLGAFADGRPTAALDPFKE